MQTSRAFIAGCAGTVLSQAEQRFFAAARPWGFILFRRNIDNPEQVRALTASLRETVGWHAPILVDQEGGRVQRLAPPHWQAYPAARRFSAINDPLVRREAVRLCARLMAHDLSALGLDVDCTPVVDVPVKGAHDVIGDRAYAADVDEVSVMARACAEGMLAGGVMPVIKHIPGHGRALADSHHALPVVSASREELVESDFLAFRRLADMPAAMTAHVVYAAIDAKRPATISRTIVREIIRGEIGFDGLLMTDDLSMKALGGSFSQRTKRALAAGCDLVLHCHGVMAEMEEIAEAVPLLRGKAAARAEAALARIRHAPEPLREAEARARLDSLLQGAEAAADPTAYRQDVQTKSLETQNLQTQNLRTGAAAPTIAATTDKTRASR
jgi:beta-N-acetylhexosaminidase